VLLILSLCCAGTTALLDIIAGGIGGHQGKTTESEEGDATPDLLLKHLDITLAIYETFKTCV